MVALLYDGLVRHRISPARRRSLMGSVYGVLELLADADVALGDASSAAASLDRCLSAAAAVTPGSDLHVIVAARAAEAAENLHGQGSPAAARAAEACEAALTARYGDLPAPMLERLAHLNRTLYG